MGEDRKTILIVDDVPENIDVLGGILIDYKRIFALNGKNALKKAMSDAPPDLILLDIMMPGMDGYEVCKKLKSQTKTKDIPVIFISARNESEDEARGFEIGAVDYITKPVTPSIVRARVKTHLELKEKRQQLEEQNKELIEAAKLREDVERLTRHDLKNPLNAVIGYPKLIMDEENLSKTSKSFLSEIEKSGYRMLKMINHSLDIFKMERGIYQLNRAPVDILKLVRLIDSEMYEIKNKNNLKINIMKNGKLPAVNEDFIIMGEELLCYSMLGNLIKNAFEASPKGEIVNILLSKEQEYIIRIINKGVVPREIRDKFFDKYITINKNAGTGLGTYSAKLTAETHEGRIRMKTDNREGTTISIFLPVKMEKPFANNDKTAVDNNVLDLKNKGVFQPIKLQGSQLEAIMSSIDNMMNYLEIGDTRAENYLNSLKQDTKGLEIENSIKILEKQIEDYDFDTACDLLASIKQFFTEINS